MDNIILTFQKKKLQYTEIIAGRLKSMMTKLFLRFTLQVLYGGIMGFIHCCSGLRHSKSFIIEPRSGFIFCQADILEKCPVCGHYVLQITRIDFDNCVSIVRKKNSVALTLFEKLKNFIICEKNQYFSLKNAGKSAFYLNYSEFGHVKKCYSNISRLSIGKTETYQGLYKQISFLKLKPFEPRQLNLFKN